MAKKYQEIYKKIVLLQIGLVLIAFGVDGQVVQTSYASFPVEIGTIKHSKNIECKNNKVLYITSARFITKISTASTSAVTMFPEGSWKNKKLLLEVQRILNFKQKIPKSFTVHSLQNKDGELKVSYKCVNASQGCSAGCKETCINTLEGGECMCLQVPNKKWTIPICAETHYTGCYNISTITPEYQVKVSKLFIPNACIQMCQLLGFEYAFIAGLNTGCICQHHLNNTYKVSEENCLAACSFRPEYSCGRDNYAHIYNTSVVRMNTTSCDQEDICPIGTRCVELFDSYLCICNPKSKDFMPLNCYGCLENWFTTVDSNVCYSAVDISPTMDTQCKAVYGETLDYNSDYTFENLMLFFRMILKFYIDKMTPDLEARLLREYGQHGGDLGWVADQIPICKREKTPIRGKFPWSMWPGGSFGLPMPKSHCPLGYGFKWEDGYFSQDTENTNNGNNQSVQSNLEASVTKDYIRQSFCIKKSVTPFNRTWPAGRYCIYKKGPCPEEMHSGEIYWDDEDKNNTNKGDGSLPDGMFKADTIIKFCCSVLPINEHGITLPRDRPFFLFPFGSAKCQPVVGTTSSLEYLQYDLENDFGNINSVVAFNGSHPYAEITKEKHLVLYYCYYQPVLSCGAPRPTGVHVQFPSHNFSVGSILRYQCSPGYQNVGDKEDICLKSEVWSSIQGAKCVDINECLSGHTCHVKANCHNTKGSYHCVCNPGWRGDGKNCTIIACSKPTIDNGEIMNIHTREQYFPKSILKIRCFKGFDVIGCHNSYCLQSGQWDMLPECKAISSYCVQRTYDCEDKVMNPGFYQTKPNKVNKKRCCTCRPEKPVIETSTKQPVTEGKSTWTNTMIVIVCALVGFIVIMILGLLILLKLKQRDTNRHKAAMRERSIQSNASIYADIDEIQLNLDVDARKGSSSSNTTQTTELKYTPHVPHVPPRYFNPEINRKTSLFQSRDSLQFRRRSDFGSSDLFLVPPKQFSTIFENEKAPRQNTVGYCDSLDNQTTQFKLHSLSTQNKRRRHSEFCFPTPYQQQPLQPTLSNLSNISDSATPVNQPVIDTDHSDNDEVENPYIDVTYNQCSIDNETSGTESDIESRYGKVPKNTLFVGYRYRSKTISTHSTGLETARETYDYHMKKDLKRSQSLPNEWTTFHDERLGSCNSSTGSDEVFIPLKEMNELKESLPRKRKTGFPRLSLKLKLTAMRKKKSTIENEVTVKPPQENRKASFTERLTKNLFTRDNTKARMKSTGSFKQRNRSDTNPF